MGGSSRQKRGADPRRENPVHRGKSPGGGNSERAHAAGGVAIVQNPNTGEILALANQPTFDPNDFNASSVASRLDRAVGWVYEPGSTFKLIAVAAALEEKLTTPEEIIDCQGGKIVLAGHTIHDDKPHYVLSLTDMVAESSDVGTIKLAIRLGRGPSLSLHPCLRLRFQNRRGLAWRGTGSAAAPQSLVEDFYRRDVHWAGSRGDPTPDGHDVFRHCQWWNTV